MMQQIALQPHFWILPVVGGVLAALAVGLIVVGVRFDFDGLLASGILAAIFGASVLIVWLVLLIPYSSEYLMFYRVTGEVESVTRSFSGGSGDLTMQPVAVISGFDRPVVVDDPRIYSYVGDRVDLTCSIEWVPYGEDRINCFIAATH